MAGKCISIKWYSDVSEARSTQDVDTNNEDDSEFKIIITLHRAQTSGDTGS